MKKEHHRTDEEIRKAVAEERLKTAMYNKEWVRKNRELIREYKKTWRQMSNLKLQMVKLILNQ